MVKRGTEKNRDGSSMGNFSMNKKFVWIAVGVVILIGAVLLCYFIFFANSVSFKLYEKNGISIKYPSDWQYFDSTFNVSEGPKAILFSKSLLEVLSGSITLGIEEGVNSTLEQDIEEFSSSLTDAGEDVQSSISDSSFAGFPAKRISIVSSESGVSMNVVMLLAVSPEKTRYTLSLISTDSNLVGIFNEMAKSFKIITKSQL